LTTVAPERPRPQDPLRLFEDVPPARGAGAILAPEPVERPAAPAGGRLTLEQRLDRVWDALLTVGSTACPVCAGRMERDPAGGSCAGCGGRIR
jgi:hypothetical protein